MGSSNEDSQSLLLGASVTPFTVGSIWVGTISFGAFRGHDARSFQLLSYTQNFYVHNSGVSLYVPARDNTANNSLGSTATHREFLPESSKNPQFSMQSISAAEYVFILCQHRSSAIVRGEVLRKTALHVGLNCRISIGSCRNRTENLLSPRIEGARRYGSAPALTNMVPRDAKTPRVTLAASRF